VLLGIRECFHSIGDSRVLLTLSVVQGKEMAQHAQFSIDTGVDVYFCDPKSPWQRGTNENTNGLLRQYFPKGTDMRLLTQEELDQAAYSLNTPPRHTLGGMTPSDKLAETMR
jgi:IS30 family transposase